MSAWSASDDRFIEGVTLAIVLLKLKFAQFCEDFHAALLVTFSIRDKSRASNAFCRFVTDRFTEGSKGKFEQKEAKLAKVRHLPSRRLFFRTWSPTNLGSPRDFKTPIHTKDCYICEPTGAGWTTATCKLSEHHFASFAYFCSNSLRFLPQAANSPSCS